MTVEPTIDPARPPATVAVLGSGRVGRVLAAGWARAGRDVLLGSRDPAAAETRGAPPGVRVMESAAAAAAADVVVVALPFARVQEALADLGATSGAWAGKVVVDVTNPVPAPPAGAASGAAVLAAAAPGARIVKAFNSVGVEVMAQPRIGGRAVDLLMCGDDTPAKSVVSALAADLGFVAIDAGGLSLAAEIEALARLWMVLARRGHGRRAAFAWLADG